MLLLDSTLDEHMILGPSKVVWTHTTFGSEMHHLPPRSSPAIPWFVFWTTQGILTLEHVAGTEMTCGR
jgi:hypothetical protein